MQSDKGGEDLKEEEDFNIDRYDNGRRRNIFCRSRIMTRTTSRGRVSRRTKIVIFVNIVEGGGGGGG